MGKSIARLDTRWLFDSTGARYASRLHVEGCAKQGASRLVRCSIALHVPSGVAFPIVIPTYMREAWTQVGLIASDACDDPYEDECLTKIDNPPVSAGVELAELMGSGGAYLEEVEVAASGYLTFNADFEFSTYGEGLADLDGLSGFGSVSDDLFARPRGVDGDFFSPATDPFFDGLGTGLRVGHSPLEIVLRKTDRSMALADIASPKVFQLDPDVLLVPIEVAVIYSANYPLEPYRRRGQLAFWDHVAQADKASFTSGGELDSTQRDGFTIVASFEEPPPMGQHYRLGMQITPDSLFERCGVQFRMVSYLEAEREERFTIPVRSATIDEPTDTLWPEHTSDGAPCYDNDDFASGLPGARTDIPRVIVTERAEFQDAPEAARALLGRRSVCVSFTNSEAPDTALGHELGHLAFDSMVHCTTGDPDCSLMADPGPGPPTASECDTIRTWAANFTSRLQRP